MLDKGLLMDDKVKRRLIEENSIVPENIEQIIKKAGNSLSKRNKSTIVIKKVAAVFMALIIGVGVFGAAMPSYAEDIPLIGSIFKAIDKKLYSKYDNYALKVNMSEESNGLKVTVNNVAYDGIFLCIDYTVEGKEPLKFEPQGLLMDLKINKKNTMSLCTGASKGMFSKDKKSYRGMAETYLRSNNSLLGSDIPESFTLDINIKKMFDSKGGTSKQLENEISGVWNYSTQVTSEKLKGKVKEIVCSVNLNKLENGMEINKLILTPMNTTLEGKNINALIGLGCIVYDDKERVLPFNTIGSTSDGQLNYFKMSFRESYSDAKSLTFIPYKIKEAHVAKLLNADLNIKGETIIPLGKYGELKITRIDVDNGETKVYYKSKYGAFTAPLRIVDKENCEEINLKTMGEYLEDKGEYVATFDKSLGDRKYILQYRSLDDIITVFDDLKFTVDINK